VSPLTTVVANSCPNSVDLLVDFDVDISDFIEQAATVKAVWTGASNLTSYLSERRYATTAVASAALRRY